MIVKAESKFGAWVLDKLPAFVTAMVMVGSYLGFLLWWSHNPEAYIWQPFRWGDTRLDRPAIVETLPADGDEHRAVDPTEWYPFIRKHKVFHRWLGVRPNLKGVVVLTPGERRQLKEKVGALPTFLEGKPGDYWEFDEGHFAPRSAR